MMICSMTAFARQSGEGNWGRATWEIRSINHRYLEIYARLPEDLRVLESELRDRVSAKLNRGKIDCSLRYSQSPEIDADFKLNHDLIGRLLKAAHEIEPTASIDPMDVLKWQGVLELPPLDVDIVRAPIFTVLEDALRQLVETRSREGTKLHEAVQTRCSAAGEQVALLQTRIPEIIADARQRYTQRVLEIADNLDEARLEQECALLAQKLDIAEEIDRLSAHLAEIERVLERAGAVGRRLDFLMQEMHREANTVGSKSAHIDTTNASLELKVLIEQMREQVQNIE